MASKINTAVCVSPRTVRVTYDAATNSDGSALVPANYSLTPSGPGPYFTPTPVSVVDTATPPTSTPTIVDVTLDQEPTPGTLFTIVATGVTGVASDSIHNVGLFWPLVPAAPPTRDYSIIDLMPPVNVAEDSTGDLARFVACLQEVANQLWADIDNWGSIFDLDKSPENFVDLILKGLGNPISLTYSGGVSALTLVEKRKLCAVLVEIYRIKGTIPGLIAAIKFFVGLPAQISNFFGMGATLGLHGDPQGGMTYSHDTGTKLGSPSPPGSWILGGGDAFALMLKCGTPGGVALTADQVARITEVVEKMKPSLAHFERAPIASFVNPVRTDIKDAGGGSVTITCAAVAGASAFQLFFRAQPGVSEWNGSVVALVGTGPAALTFSPGVGVTRYWVACQGVPHIGIPGLISNEVTNALTATPVLTATPQARNIRLSWPAISGATSYRIYKSATAKVQPSAADNAATPIRVNASATPTFDDPQTSVPTTAYYIVVPLIGDSEGFYSNEAHATSL